MQCSCTGIFRVFKQTFHNYLLDAFLKNSLTWIVHNYTYIGLMWGNWDGIPMSVKSGAAKRRLFLLNLPCLPPIPPSIITKLWAKYKISIMLIYWLPCRPISPMQRVDGKKQQHLLSQQKLLSTSPIKGQWQGNRNVKKKTFISIWYFPNFSNIESTCGQPWLAFLLLPLVDHSILAEVAKVEK